MTAKLESRPVISKRSFFKRIGLSAVAAWFAPKMLATAATEEPLITYTLTDPKQFTTGDIYVNQLEPKKLWVYDGKGWKLLADDDGVYEWPLQ